MGEKCVFMIEDDSALIRYNEIWDKIKMTLNKKCLLLMKNTFKVR